MAKANPNRARTNKSSTILKPSESEAIFLMNTKKSSIDAAIRIIIIIEKIIIISFRSFDSRLLFFVSSANYFTF